MDAYLNIVFNDIIFGDMHKHLLVKYLIKIWYTLQREPINQDRGSTSITHGSQNWNRMQSLSFCLLRQSHTVRSSKPSPPKFFVGQKTVATCTIYVKHYRNQLLCRPPRQTAKARMADVSVKTGGSRVGGPELCI